EDRLGHRRPHRSRLDGEHAEPVRLHLRREVLGEPNEGGLAGDVGGQVRDGPRAGAARHVHDPAATAGQHARQHRLAAQPPPPPPRGGGGLAAGGRAGPPPRALSTSGRSGPSSVPPLTTAASPAAGSVTSAGQARARPPAAVMLLTASASWSAERASTATAAP